MKRVIKLLVLLTIMFIPVVVSASSNVTIDKKSYNKSTHIFHIEGAVSTDYAIVALYDGEEQIAMYVAEKENNNYNADIKITFNETKTVTIKVGDITGTSYALDTLEVEQSLINISKTTVTGIEAKTYNGQYQEQENLKVTYNQTELIKDTDYTVEYQDNAYTGTAKVIITGIGNYTGSVTKTFKINPIDLSSGVVTGAVSKIYTGKSQTQSALVVKWNGIKLALGRDYTVSYSNNKNIGNAKYAINGKGNFTGTINKTFNIVPQKATIYKPTVGIKKVTIKYKAVSGSVKYQIAYKLKTSSTWKYIKTSKTSYTKTSLKSKKYYNIKVRAYKIVNNKTYYGAWSATKTVKVK